MNKNKLIKKILLSTVLFAAAALSVTFIISDFLWYTVTAGYGATLLLWLGSILTAAYKKERGYIRKETTSSLIFYNYYTIILEKFQFF